MNKKSIKIYKFNIERAIVLIIALCMIFLINFANTKLNEIAISEREALLMKHDPINPIHNELAQKIREFRPDVCKMIEVYSDEFDQLFSVQFKENTLTINNNLSDYAELVELFKTNKEGHTNIEIDDNEEDIYFQWVDTSEGKHYLIIIYMSKPIVENLWVFEFVCYLILVLVFVLIIRLHMIQQQDKIRYYQTISNETRRKLMH